MKPVKNKYNQLLIQIKQLVEEARHNIARNINVELLKTYWMVGRLIVEKEKTEQYDDVSLRQMFIDLSKELTRELGKGFSRSNLFAMRNLYKRFNLDEAVLTPSGQKSKSSISLAIKSRYIKSLTVSYQLSWSHYYELLKSNNELEISFYQQTTINESWSVRELHRQMDSALFERIALSKNVNNLIT